jgi:hypothetical protein
VEEFLYDTSEKEPEVKGYEVSKEHQHDCPETKM